MAKEDLERERRTKDELDKILLNEGLLKGIEEAPDIPAIRKQAFQNFEKIFKKNYFMKKKSYIKIK